MLKQNNDLLFVYGTLKANHSNDINELCAGKVRFVGTGTTTGSLYDLGNYPAMTESRDGVITGEIYEVLDKPYVMAIVDDYEGCSADYSEPHEYKRCLQSVKSGDQELCCWLYLYNVELPESAVFIDDGCY